MSSVPSINTPAAKITLASTSKISLNERFTKLAKTSIVQASSRDKIKRVGVPLKSSETNRKLALQMASRPTVQAALTIKNKTLNQRLGDGFIANRQGNFRRKPIVKRNGLMPNYQTAGIRNIKQRLGTGPGLVQSPRLGGRIKIIGQQVQTRLINGRYNNGKRFRNPNFVLNRLAPNQGNNFVVNRVKNNNGFKIRNKFQKVNNLNGRIQNRGVKTNFRKNQKLNNNQQQTGPVVPKNKESLDMDLDSYMAKTKSHLDAELDGYMAQSTTI